ncbi:MAG TPA: NAD(P)-dependent oxidoreductase [Egibacteraceae bacterium]|nr:NAD(P)-dependent oxidoreductase [Egibacteraceae bacterium]
MTHPAAPLLVRLAGRRVVGVGGGTVAAAKLLPLVRDHGAQVVVISPQLHPSLSAHVTWRQRTYDGAEDLAGAVLAVAATDDAQVNERVAADAEAAGVLCVRSDADGDGTASFPATVRRGPLTIAVGTDGRSPTVARWLREQIEREYGAEYGALVELLGELRDDPAIRAHLSSLPASARRTAWRSIPLLDILAMLRSGSVETAKEVAAACLSSSSD